MRSHARRAQARAVVLLEVLVALTLLAGSGLVALAWVQQSLESVSRTQRIALESQLARNAQALIALVNPATEPSGSIEQPGLRVEWTSRRLEPMQAIHVLGLEGRVAQPPWRVGLFELDVKAQPLPEAVLNQAGASRPVAFTMLTVGYQATRPLAGGRP